VNIIVNILLCASLGIRAFSIHLFLKLLLCQLKGKAELNKSQKTNSLPATVQAQTRRFPSKSFQKTSP